MPAYERVNYIISIIIILTRIRKMVGFELGKEIDKDVYSLATNVGQRKSTLPILAVYSTQVVYELRNEACSP